MPPRRWHIVLAYAAVYILWGSTYFAIRIGIETVPPLFLAGVRFLLAGLPLLAVEMIRTGVRPRARHWREATILGGLMLAGGNGGVSFAELTVPSSIAALFITTVPLWMVLLDAFVWRRSRLSGLMVAGLMCGFLGVVLLVGPADDAAAATDRLGAIVLLGAALSWALGSLRSRDAELPGSGMLAVAMQMVGGGVVLLIAAAVRGESLSFSAFTGESVLALLYLAIFGSIVAFSAYIWLLRHQPASSVSTYAYVNPVVAVLLGWGFGGEELLGRQLGAGALIVGAVVLLHRARSRRLRRSDAGQKGPVVEGAAEPVEG